MLSFCCDLRALKGPSYFPLRRNSPLFNPASRNLVGSAIAIAGTSRSNSHGPLGGVSDLANLEEENSEATTTSPRALRVAVRRAIEVCVFMNQHPRTD